MMASLLVGCQKQVPFDKESSRLIPEKSGTKSSGIINLSFFAGHDGSKCPGCITIAGHTMHKDCQGHGNNCRKTSRVFFQQSGTDIIATTTDTFDLTTEGFFLMPSRSLDYFDENNNRHYLNIPEQLVFRDSTTLQFTFTGLSFTDRPLY